MTRLLSSLEVFSHPNVFIVVCFTVHMKVYFYEVVNPCGEC